MYKGDRPTGGNFGASESSEVATHTVTNPVHGGGALKTLQGEKKRQSKR